MKTLERVGTGGGSESGGDKHLYPRTLLDLCEKLTGSYDLALLSTSNRAPSWISARSL